MDMSQYKDLFISEALEHLQMVNQKLVEMERNPHSSEALEQIFRSAHTIKGMAATMGYTNISQLAHALEDKLDQVRQGEQSVTSTLMDLLFAGADSMSKLIEDVAADRPSELDVQELVNRLQGKVPEAEISESDIQDSTSLPTDVMEVQVTLAADCQTKNLRAYMILERLRHLGEVVSTEPPEELLTSQGSDRIVVYLRSGTPSEQVQGIIEGISEVETVRITLPKDKPPAAQTEKSPADSKTIAPPQQESEQPVQQATQTSMVRVNVQHLDVLLNLVSELVISHGQMTEEIKALETSVRQHGLSDQALLPMKETLERQDRKLGRLHEAVLQVRMVPMSQIFDRFPRMIRDLGRDLGKEVNLEILGRNVEMDRTTLESLSEPLVHLLRNAMDHGLESPKERAIAGKPRQGTIELSARRERGQAIIQISDDGQGMDVERILQTAIERGVVAQERAHELNEHQILMLICQPGFSMARQVTGVSGRGVGMNVVKRQVEALRGSMEIETELGGGTTFRLLLPLSLALTQALLVKIGKETYAVPLHHIERTIEIEPERIQTLHRWKILRRENEALPIFRLSKLLGTPELGLVKGNGLVGKQALVVRRGNQHLGLIVDDLLDKQEIVVKPLPKSLTGISGLSGTTIVGTGQVIMILDIPNLVQGLV